MGCLSGSWARCAEMLRKNETFTLLYIGFTFERCLNGCRAVFLNIGAAWALHVEAGAHQREDCGGGGRFFVADAEIFLCKLFHIAVIWYICVEF